MFSFPRNLRTEHDRNQPRVPAGNPDGGQWTISGGSGDLDEFSAAKRRRPGSWQGPERWDPRTWWSPVMRALFDSLRKRERLDDLLGDKRGVVVAWTEINGKEIFGVNARSREYTSTDNSAARRLRAALIEKYPETIDIVDIGRYPNAAVFHAEVTTLLRAAVQNGGTLAGQTLTVYVDAKICASCPLVLPKIGLELGNPTVTFVPAVGKPRTMKDGDWLD